MERKKKEQCPKKNSKDKKKSAIDAIMPALSRHFSRGEENPKCKTHMPTNQIQDAYSHAVGISGDDMESKGKKDGDEEHVPYSGFTKGVTSRPANRRKSDGSMLSAMSASSPSLVCSIDLFGLLGKSAGCIWVDSALALETVRLA